MAKLNKSTHTVVDHANFLREITSSVINANIKLGGPGVSLF